MFIEKSFRIVHVCQGFFKILILFQKVNVLVNKKQGNNDSVTNGMLQKLHRRLKFKFIQVRILTKYDKKQTNRSSKPLNV